MTELKELPENWKVSPKDETQLKALELYRGVKCLCDYRSASLSSKGWIGRYTDYAERFEEITFEQFEKYVLNKDTKLKVGDKVPEYLDGKLLFGVKMGIISLIVFIAGVWCGMSIMPIIVPFWIGGLITLSLIKIIHHSHS